MNSRLHIAPATPKDLEQVMALEHKGFLPGIIERKDVFLDRIRVFPEGFLLAKLGPEHLPIGYICSELWTRLDSVDPAMFELNHGIESTHRPDGDEIYVSSMTIDPKYRGCGHGRELFTTCLSQIAGKHPQVSSVLLIVNETWSHARRIYVADGFSELFHIPCFFAPDNLPEQDAIVMRRSINLEGAHCS